MKMLEDGSVPFSKVGRHRRARLECLLAFRDRMVENSAESLREVAAAQPFVCQVENKISARATEDGAVHRGATAATSRRGAP